MSASPVTEYINSLNHELSTGRSTEHSFRLAFKTFTESFRPGITAINEPRRVECGAPDYRIEDNSNLLIGYIETKDIGVSLSEIEKTDQLKRYRDSLDNIILTDYLEFKWFVHGELRTSSSLGSLSSERQIIRDRTGEKEVLELLHDFFNFSPEPIGRADELAERLARNTRAIRDILEESSKSKKLSDGISNLYETLRRDLIPNLVFFPSNNKEKKAPQFASIFAQCIAYGLFAAKCNQTTKPFRLEDASREIPRTNPFMRDLFYFITGPNFDDEPYANYVRDLVQLLENTDIESVLKDFGKRKRNEDPIIHFYETFLSRFDPDERERRGVYYTPSSVVSFIVRSIDIILKEQFGCREGLADKTQVEATYLNSDGKPEKIKSHKILILDPACGTGSFLYGIIDHIRNRFSESGNAGQWAGYVREHLIPRLFGFELLMAPYAVAHLKLGMQLEARDMTEEQQKTWAVELSGNDRLNIYMTDSLEPSGSIGQTFSFGSDFINKEVNSASDIKSKYPIMVVLGNPPYSGHSSKPSFEYVTLNGNGKKRKQLNWIGKLIEDYKKVDGGDIKERNIKWIQDDYIKFIRLGQWRIERSGSGVLTFITNHSYLDSPTFRGMRQTLMKTFDKIYILNLHGNAKKREKCDNGSKDENVFDIQQGVTIGIFIKETEGEVKSSLINYAEFQGSRDLKDKYLFDNSIDSVNWTVIYPLFPFYLFIPQDIKRRSEYIDYPSITNLISSKSVGIVTSRDNLTIAFTKEELSERIDKFIDLDPEEARRIFNLGEDSSDWRIDWAQNDIKAIDNRQNSLIPILYRPFDIRWTYYTGKSHGFHCRPRLRFMERFINRESLGIIVGRSGAVIGSDIWDIAFVTDMITDLNIFRRGGGYIHNAYLIHKANIGKNIIKKTNSFSLKDSIYLTHLLHNIMSDNSKAINDSNDLIIKPINYIYSMLFSNKYRLRYREYLNIDYPRIPKYNDIGIFNELARLGGELIDVHLLRSELLFDTRVSYPIPGSNIVERGYPKYYAQGKNAPENGKPLERGRVYINGETSPDKITQKGQYFEGVSPAVWEFHIGGYQVLDKWLKERRGRNLSNDDIDHFKRIVKALEETIRIMKEIDDTIPGWPLP